MSKEDEYAAVYALTNLGQPSSSSPVLVSQFPHPSIHFPPYNLSKGIIGTPCSGGVVRVSISQQVDSAMADADTDDEPESVDPNTNTKFPLKLFDILDSQKYSDMIQWLPQGTGFFFVNKKRFEAVVLPLFFQKRTKFTSFTRRLIRWGFTRVARGSFLGSYFHALFQQGNRSLCVELCSRLRNKKVIMRQEPFIIGGEHHNKMGPNDSHTFHHRNLGLNRMGYPIREPSLSMSSSSTASSIDNPNMNNNKPDSSVHQDPNAFIYAYYAHKKGQNFKKIVMLRLLEQKRQQLILQNQYMQMANAQNQQLLLAILGKPTTATRTSDIRGYSHPAMTTNGPAMNAPAALTTNSTITTASSTTAQQQPIIPTHAQRPNDPSPNHKSIYGAYAA